jgi:hypothetical protein
MWAHLLGYMNVNFGSTIKVQKHDKQWAMVQIQMKRGVATTSSTQQKLKEFR